ncbi:MAG: hypothetical protein JJW00_00230 [Sulfurimonas sp.]|nr:hypothetical protein [Sulfurimonas sp.]
MAVVEYKADNLIVAGKELITSDVLKLESGVVVRGEVLKKGTTGLVKFNGTDDIPYCISLQNIDASGSVMSISYTTCGSVLGSELVFANGALGDFRDAFVTETQISVEE